MNYSITAPHLIKAEIGLPASKSISNRALVINALVDGDKCRIANTARCDDTDAIVRALNDKDDYVNIGAAGTAMRFLTAYYAVQYGHTVTLDGTARMRHRPIGVLVDALNACGADIRYTGENGFPPLEIHGHKCHCDTVTIDAGISSQFISAMLMVAPVIGCERVALSGNITSRSYIDMTLGVMRDFGINSQFSDDGIISLSGSYTAPPAYAIENDWSAASYWFALQAMLPQSRISLRGLFPVSLQGDSRVRDLFIPFGVEAYSCGNYVDLRSERTCCDTTLTLDLSNNPDLAQTIVVAACMKGMKFHITGLHTLKIKETDRIEALRSQLRKLGFILTADDDSLSWSGENATPDSHPLIETFDDHRMAMAFAPAAVAFPGLEIADVEVVSKSYPDFWLHLANCGFKLKET